MTHDTTGLPALIAVSAPATRAQTDGQLLDSWLASLTSQHSRRNFETTLRRFLSVAGIRSPEPMMQMLAPQRAIPAVERIVMRRHRIAGGSGRHASQSVPACWL